MFPNLFSSCVPVPVERVDQDKDAEENVVRIGRPVESEQSIGLFTQREELDIDFRVSGFPYAVVKQAENFSVRELAKKIESHPHREALQAELQQNNACKPFNDESKEMIRAMGNVELFESCKTIAKVQCSECLLQWNQGIVHCTCGHLLKESEASQHCHQWRLDAFSIENYVIKKEDSVAHNARRRCLKKKIEGIHDRFLKTQHIVISSAKLAGLKRRALRLSN